MLTKNLYRRYALEINRSLEELGDDYVTLIEEISSMVYLHELLGEWLIVKSEHDYRELSRFLQDRKLLGETMNVLEIPVLGNDALDDFGLNSTETVYLWEKEIALFMWDDREQSADQLAAFEQMEEDLITYFTLEDGQKVLVAPFHLKELFTGIAAAYRVKISEIN